MFILYMEELKTLKDFSDEDCFVKFYPARLGEKLRKQRFIEEKMLRQEGIKWIKDIEEKKKQGQFVKAEDLIKYIFNISDEELK